MRFRSFQVWKSAELGNISFGILKERLVGNELQFLPFSWPEKTAWAAQELISRDEVILSKKNVEHTEIFHLLLTKFVSWYPKDPRQPMSLDILSSF